MTARINEAKRRYYTNTIEENKADSAKLWKTLKTVITPDVAASPIETITLEGSDITDPKLISAKFESFFKTAVEQLRQVLPAVRPQSPTRLLSSARPDQRSGYIDLPGLCFQATEGYEVQEIDGFPWYISTSF